MRPEQSRMARAALEWTLELTARNSGVTPNTIRRFERGGISNNSTVMALAKTYEATGILFLDDDGQGRGVRFRKPSNFERGFIS